MISVILPVYKEKDTWLREAIESILDQTYKDIEIIIILDNPENQELKEIILEYQKLDQRIKFFENPQNIGLTATLNFGIGLATGEFIARMDADDISIKTRLEKQVEFARKHCIDILGSNIIEFTEDNVTTWTSNFLCKDYQIKKNIFRGNQLAHPSWLVRREVYEELKGYRNIPACEDYDFLLRAIKKGYVLGNTKEPLLKYRINPNSISRKNILKQKMASRYLVDNFEKLEFLDLNEIDEIFKNTKKMDEEENKYAKSMRLLQEYHFTRNIFALFRACVSSRKFFQYHIIDRLKQKISIKNKGKKSFLILKYQIKLGIYYFFRTKLISNNDTRKKIILIDVPQFANLGDHAIAQAERSFFEKYFPEYSVYEIPIDKFTECYYDLRKKIKKEDKIILIGGGNLGIEYFILELHRRQIIQNFQNQIFLFPQTMYFGMSRDGLHEMEKTIKIYSDNKNLRLMAREKYTYHIMKANFENECYLFPDIVLSVNLERKKSPTNNVLCVMRNDIEGVLKEEDKKSLYHFLEKHGPMKITDTVLDYHVSLETRSQELERCFQQFYDSKIIITDRLHGMIFAYITKTPCIVFGNYNYKIKGVYETWLKDSNLIYYCENIYEFEGIFDKIKNERKYKLINFDEQFEQLCNAIKGEK